MRGYEAAVWFEVLTAMILNNNIFWDVAPCSVVEVYGCFWETYCLCFQGGRIRQANRLIPICLYYLILKMEAVYPSKTSVNITRLHGITSQKIVLFKMKLIVYLMLFTMFQYSGNSTVAKKLCCQRAYPAVHPWISNCLF